MKDVATGLAVELKNYVDIAEMIAFTVITNDRRVHAAAATLWKQQTSDNYSFLSFRNEDISKNRKITFSHAATFDADDALQPVKNKRNNNFSAAFWIASLEIHFLSEIYRRLSPWKFHFYHVHRIHFALRSINRFSFAALSVDWFVKIFFVHALSARMHFFFAFCPIPITHSAKRILHHVFARMRYMKKRKNVHESYGMRTWQWCEHACASSWTQNRIYTILNQLARNII